MTINEGLSERDGFGFVFCSRFISVPPESNQMGSVSRIRQHWFVDDCPVVLSADHYMRCAFPSCPFSVKVRPAQDDGSFIIDHVVFDQHCHLFGGKSRRKTKAFVLREKQMMKVGLDSDRSLEKKHAAWKHKADEDVR